MRSEAKGETGQREVVMARVGMLAARLLKNNARCHGSYLISHVCTLVSILVSSSFFFFRGGGGRGRGCVEDAGLGGGLSMFLFLLLGVGDGHFCTLFKNLLVVMFMKGLKPLPPCGKE